MLFPVTIPASASVTLVNSVLESSNALGCEVKGNAHSRLKGRDLGWGTLAFIATARKLAVLLHRLWVSGEAYEPLRNSKPVGYAGSGIKKHPRSEKPKRRVPVTTLIAWPNFHSLDGTGGR